MQLRDNLAALGEMSAGIAAQFEKSLAHISTCAHKLTVEDDVAAQRQYAFRIDAESKQLSRALSDLLEPKGPRQDQELRTQLESIVARHGGTLKVSSDTSGTTFTISVPAAQRARAAAMV
jgi:C4-dicarboxylate-specific signal transduction histidine kinase